jgi:hypothetical protein
MFAILGDIAGVIAQVAVYLVMAANRMKHTSQSLMGGFAAPHVFSTPAFIYSYLHRPFSTLVSRFSWFYKEGDHGKTQH